MVFYIFPLDWKFLPNMKPIIVTDKIILMFWIALTKSFMKAVENREWKMFNSKINQFSANYDIAEK